MVRPYIFDRFAALIASTATNDFTETAVAGVLVCRFYSIPPGGFLDGSRVCSGCCISRPVVFVLLCGDHASIRRISDDFDHLCPHGVLLKFVDPFAPLRVGDRGLVWIDNARYWIWDYIAVEALVYAAGLVGTCHLATRVELKIRVPNAVIRHPGDQVLSIVI